MNKHEAEKLLADFFARFGKSGSAFKETNLVKASIGEAILAFNFSSDKQRLACHALIYRFHREPRPQVLREIEIAEQNGAETGGGAVVFDAENLNLSLVRFYSIKIESLLFTAQMQKLAAASLTWSSAILNRIATKSNKV